MSKGLIIYWSSTGNTEQMAKAIEEGMKDKGGEVDLLEVNNADTVNVDEYTHIALGCSAMGAEVLSDEMEEYFQSIKEKLANKNILLFGSYDWGDGHWMRSWEDEVRNLNGILYQNAGVIVQNEPSNEDKEKLKMVGSLYIQ